MAVRDLKQSSTLLIKFKVGVDSRGNDIFKIINLRKVKTTAQHQDIYDVAQAIATLVDGTLSGVLRQDLAELINE
ncbi:DUF1659 domain-containing protein [Thermobrachium celere]|uniref:DUF1659 domain-containing protein n=1 Tax=Thermobrachium celere DSM 8682 TaxID=941824 RepID=R7RQ25_9CLOT|nr:DUF1659 domain-containing protein [Thermobrachium celere]GFR35615.1 hypothetical protein TCEA9_14270 [Thermobrachium celere]CDF57340.1 hypothetical protein TCEL_01254 [Thermobrachium celere DSM 8682]